MSKMNPSTWSKPLAEEIIRQAWPLIENDYNQEELRTELGRLGVKLSKATVSNIYSKYIKSKEKNADQKVNKELRNTGRKSLILFASGLIELFKAKKQLHFDPTSKTFVADLSEESKPLENLLPVALPYKAFIHEKGRRNVKEKISFMKNAKHEIIEMGIRLNNFSKYFIAQSDDVFTDEIIQLLKRGVNLKCLMMDPKAEITKLYFEDRAKIMDREGYAYQEMSRILEDLLQVKAALNAYNYPGKMSVHLYQNFPYAHFLVVDGAQDWGKMMYTTYIYGEKRANCPVTELYQFGSPQLYKRQWNAVQSIMNQSEEL